MKLSEAIELIKNRIDETDADEQINDIIINGFNKAYTEIKLKFFPDIETSTILSDNHIAPMPKGFNRLLRFSRQLKDGEKLYGDKLFTELQEDSIDIMYIANPSPIAELEEEIDLPYVLVYACTTYACYTYYTHRKKDNLARAYLSEYEIAKMEYNEESLDETVQDEYML